MNEYNERKKVIEEKVLEIQERYRPRAGNVIYPPIYYKNVRALQRFSEGKYKI